MTRAAARRSGAARRTRAAADPAVTVTSAGEETRRLTPAQRRQVPTESCLVEAQCRCRGMFMPNGSRVDGDWPYVSVRITKNCAGHPERVSPGVIERFWPQHIHRLSALASTP